MREEHVQDRGADGCGAETDDQVDLLAGCHVEHRDEQDEQDERRTEVLFKGDDGERDRPHGEQRKQRFGVGQAEAADAHGEHRYELAVLR